MQGLEGRKIFFFLGPLNSYAGKGVVRSETHEWPLLFLYGQQTKTICKEVVMGQNLIFVFPRAHSGKLEVAGKIENSEGEGPCFSQQSMCMQASQPGSSVIFCVGIPTFFPPTPHPEVKIQESKQFPFSAEKSGKKMNISSGTKCRPPEATIAKLFFSRKKEASCHHSCLGIFPF